jgi:hypothetical protein
MTWSDVNASEAKQNRPRHGSAERSEQSSHIGAEPSLLILSRSPDVHESGKDQSDRQSAAMFTEIFTESLSCCPL